ncbi:Glucokinase [Penicillium diatomitis]|uniref:Phosphotransferase n=1 Tax=Penicillium diatomitis TaxID=2819901 RepID=A0A9X0C2K9_9EURO|nr:Glucokinase [Penicillium diatomitis]KAJ5495581.1 Glucokinase [Penicillium diatomitis]
MTISSQKTSSDVVPQAQHIVDELDLSPDDIRRVTKHLVQKLKDGLVHDRPWQLPTYVTNVPTGTEKGRFLAIDLGGSNCRVSMADLHGDSTFTVVQSKHEVSAAVMVNQRYRPLFDFIAQKLAEFLDRHLDRRSTSPYRLGFTFSFTCEQESLRSGRLIHWDKGWDIPEAIGRDPCVMLQESIDRMGLPVRVAVLANDSVGTLLTRAYTSGRDVSTLGAVIFGTGTNAAYVEKVRNLQRLRMKSFGGDGIMVVNTEWGSLDDEMAVLPRTVLDDQLDAASVDPGCQMLEKRVSGMYLGEILRLATRRLVETGALDMSAELGSCLLVHHAIDSSLLSQLATAGDNVGEVIHCLEKTLSVKKVSPRDARSIQMIAEAITRRAARLAGASIAAVIIQSGRLQSPAKSSAAVKSKTEYAAAISAPILSYKSLCNYTPMFLRRLIDFVRIVCKLPSWMMPEAAVHENTLDHTTDTTLDGTIDFGADGSLIELYPGFEIALREAMREVTEIGTIGEQRVQITLTPDGSGVGAALMAYATSLDGEKR